MKGSVWKPGAEETSFAPLKENITVDVAIIGGGITGVTAAYLLAKEGKKVAVLEAWKVGQGSTGYSTGNLYAMVGGEGLHKIETKWNEDTLKNVVESRAAAVDFIESRVKEFNIDCQFKRVSWSLFTKLDKSKDFIDKERKAAEKAGLTTEDKVPFPADAEYGFTVPNQAQFNPLQYTAAFAKKIASNNCKIYEDTKVTDIKEEDGHCVLTTTGGEVLARRVIQATHTPKGVYLVHANMGPYREYAVAVKLNGAYPPDGTFWDMLETEHCSMRTYETPGGKVLMALGQMHKVGQKEDNDECFDRLEQFLRSKFDVASVEYKWSAQQYRPADSLPYIGKSNGDSNIYIATGFGADGLTYGTLAAMIIADDIAGRENKWSKTYDAARHSPIASAKDFIKENLNVLAQYIKDLPYKAEVEKLSDIAPGEGKTIEIDSEKYGAYRDESGKLHVVSAVCTHMKCIVHWNKEATSWDCPCHGSRFTVDGEVIEGPAIADLGKMKDKS